MACISQQRRTRVTIRERRSSKALPVGIANAGRRLTRGRGPALAAAERIYSFGVFCRRAGCPGATGGRARRTVIGMLPLGRSNVRSGLVRNPQRAPRASAAIWDAGGGDASRSGARASGLFAGQAGIRQAGQCESPDRNSDGTSKAANVFISSCIARIRKPWHDTPSSKHRTGRAMISASCFGRLTGTCCEGITSNKKTEISDAQFGF